MARQFTVFDSQILDEDADEMLDALAAIDSGAPEWHAPAPAPVRTVSPPVPRNQWEALAHKRRYGNAIHHR